MDQDRPGVRIPGQRQCLVEERVGVGLVGRVAEEADPVLAGESQLVGEPGAPVRGVFGEQVDDRLEVVAAMRDLQPSLRGHRGDVDLAGDHRLESFQGPVIPRQPEPGRDQPHPPRRGRQPKPGPPEPARRGGARHRAHQGQVEGDQPRDHHPAWPVSDGLDAGDLHLPRRDQHQRGDQERGNSLGPALLDDLPPPRPGHDDRCRDDRRQPQRGPDQGDPQGRRGFGVEDRPPAQTVPAVECRAGRRRIPEGRQRDRAAPPARAPPGPGPVPGRAPSARARSPPPTGRAPRGRSCRPARPAGTPGAADG